MKCLNWRRKSLLLKFRVSYLRSESSEIRMSVKQDFDTMGRLSLFDNNTRSLSRKMNTKTQ